MVAEPYTADDPEARLALFDFAFENAPIGIALVDLEGRINHSNAAFAKLLSLPPDKILATHFKDFTHPEDIEADLILFQQVLQGRRDGYTIVKRYLRPFVRSFTFSSTWPPCAMPRAKSYASYRRSRVSPAIRNMSANSPSGPHS